jgi:hypothetical protein
MSMRTLIATITAALLLATSHTSFALSSVVQLTRTNIHDYPLVVRTEESRGAAGSLKVFHVIVTPWAGVKPENVSGYISAYHDGQLVFSCAVLSKKLDSRSKVVNESAREESRVLEFSISPSHIAHSKFSINLWEPEGPGFSEYWFYLKDFVDAK